jgi:CheY-like chemotaxis protein
MKVLIAEDDVMQADCLAEALTEDGHVLCGIASTVADGVALAREHRPDAAIIDMQLSSVDLGSQIAEQLSESGDLGYTGILYVTGGAFRTDQEVRVGHAYLNKPYSFATLSASLVIVGEIARDGCTSRKLPRGLHLLRPARFGALAEV